MTSVLQHTPTPSSSTARAGAGNTETLSDIVRLHRLPSMPAATVRLLQLFSDPDTPLAEIVRILQSDPALAAKIVRASNTAHFSTGKPVADLQRAVLLLGRKVITSLALSFSLAESSLRHGSRAEEFRDYWLQSIVQSTAMELLSEKYAPGRAGEYAIGGLLMDIGRLALLSSTPDQYAVTLEEARRTPRPLHRLELEHFGANHPELSARFLREWGMPESLVSGVLAHHEAPVSDRTADDDTSRLTQALRVAAIVGDYLCSQWRGPARVRLIELMKRYFGADEGEMELFVNRVRRRVDEVSELFNTDAHSLRSPLEIMSLAMQQLSELVLQTSDGSDDCPDPSMVCTGSAVRRDPLTEFSQPSCLDAATLVYNFAYFRESLVEAVQEAGRRSATIGVLLIGMRAADSEPAEDTTDWDAVLHHITHGVLLSTRSSDVVARFDAAALALLTRDTTETDLEKLAARVCERVMCDIATYCGTQNPLIVRVVGLVGTPRAGNSGYANQFADRCKSALALALNEFETEPRIYRFDRTMTPVT